MYDVSKITAFDYWKPQLKSLQDSCLSMINLGMTKQVLCFAPSYHTFANNALQGYVMNIIMQRFAVVTMIFAPLTLATGFFGDITSFPCLRGQFSSCNSLHSTVAL